jgi:hypothetical protein
MSIGSRVGVGVGVMVGEGVGEGVTDAVALGAGVAVAVAGCVTLGCSATGRASLAGLRAVQAVNVRRANIAMIQKQYNFRYLLIGIHL